jgi:hypothetical protein
MNSAALFAGNVIKDKSVLLFFAIFLTIHAALFFMPHFLE